MKRRGWLIPILFFFISITGLLFYQKDQYTHSFAVPTHLPPILWSETPVNITRIYLSEKGQQIEAAIDSGDWVLTSPIAARADSSLIYHIIQTFKEPQLTKVVDTDPENLSEYGIDETSFNLKLYTKDNHIHELIRGSLADGSYYYVYAPMSNTIYTMPISTFDNFHAELNVWRDKSLVYIKEKDIEKIELAYEDTYYTLYPAQTIDGPVFKDDRLDEKALKNLIGFLTTCKVKHFITDTADSNLLKAYGFNTPHLTAKIFLKSGKAQIITVGNITKEENLCYVVTSYSNSIFAIPYFDFSALKLEEAITEDFAPLE